MNINAVSACWSAYTYEEALQKIHQGTYEPLLGALSHEHVQLCPQHKNIITPELIDSLKTLYPETQFRLHADVRILGKIGYTIDLMDYSEKTIAFSCFWANHACHIVHNACSSAKAS